MRCGDLVRVMRVHDPLDPINGWERVIAQLLLIAPGYVRVRALDDGAEWDECIRNVELVRMAS